MILRKLVAKVSCNVTVCCWLVTRVRYLANVGYRAKYFSITVCHVCVELITSSLLHSLLMFHMTLMTWDSFALTSKYVMLVLDVGQSI